MGIEERLAENTAALKELAAALATANQVNARLLAGGDAGNAKAKPEAAKTEKPADTPPTAKETAAPEPKAENSAPAVDPDALKKEFLALGNNDMPAMQAILKEFNVERLSQVKDEDKPALYKKLVAAQRRGLIHNAPAS
jgi:hypothetical protein